MLPPSAAAAKTNPSITCLLINVFMSAPQQLDGSAMGVEPVVPSVVSTFEEPATGSPSPMTQELVGAGEETIGLTPALLSSVAPSGIVPTDGSPSAPPAVDPLTLEVEAVVQEAL